MTKRNLRLWLVILVVEWLVLMLSLVCLRVVCKILQSNALVLIRSLTRDNKEQQRGYELGEAQRLEAFRNQLADMESEKARTIADAARQLYQRRVGMV
jgi:hypothetical protein